MQWKTEYNPAHAGGQSSATKGRSLKGFDHFECC